MEIIHLYIFHSYSLSKPFHFKNGEKTFTDLSHKGLSNVRTTYQKKEKKNLLPLLPIYLAKKMKSPHPNFPSRHILKLACSISSMIRSTLFAQKTPEVIDF